MFSEVSLRKGAMVIRPDLGTLSFVWVFEVVSPMELVQKVPLIGLEVNH